VRIGLIAALTHALLAQAARELDAPATAAAEPSAPERCAHHRFINPAAIAPRPPVERRPYPRHQGERPRRRR